MSIIRRVRLIAAIVLLIATCLPLSECSRRDNKTLTPLRHTLAQYVFPQSNNDFEYSYAVGAMRFSTWQAGVFAFIALVWPFAAFVFDRKLLRFRLGWLIYILELLLCGGTIYWLCLFTALGHALYGTYVVVIAIISFALATLVFFVMDIRNFLRQRRALKAGSQSA